MGNYTKIFPHRSRTSDIPSSSPILFTIGSTLGYQGWSQVAEEGRVELEIWPILFLTILQEVLLNWPALRLSLKKDLHVIARRGMKIVAPCLSLIFPRTRDCAQATNPTRQRIAKRYSGWVD